MNRREPVVAHINLAKGFRGGERQTQLLIQALQHAGWRQVLVARRNEPLANKCASIEGLDLRPVSGNVLAGTSGLHGADLVHVHEGRSALPGFLNWQIRRIPFLITRRIQLAPRNTILNRLTYRHAAALVAVSAAIARSIAALSGSAQISVVPDATSALAVNPDLVQTLKRRFAAEMIIGHIGALDDSHKGQLQIIELARQCAQAGHKFSFVLVGSGRDERRLRAAAAKLPNVHFTGFVDDVGSYLAAFDVFLYPSRHEGLGSILLDALAAGLPIIASSVGGIPEIIKDGENGMLCEPNDIESMYSALLRLNADAELRRKISHRNRLAADAFSSQKMAAAYMQHYRALANQHSKGQQS